MTYRTSIPAVTVSVVLLLAACSSGDTPETSDTTTPDTTVTTTSIEDTSTTGPPATTATVPPTDPPSTTAPPTTEPPATTEPPVSTVPGEPDWFKTVSELRAIMDEIVRNPDPSRVLEVAVEGGEWETVTGSAIRNSFEQGHRTVGLKPTKVVVVEFNGTPDEVRIDEALAVSLMVTIEAQDVSDAKIVDSDGNVVFDLVNDDTPGELLTSFWVLFRTDDGWRVGSIS